MTTPSRPHPSARHDFDFLAGAWHTQQRRLKKRLQGCDEWETFAATVTMAPLPGGVGNFDTMVAETWRPGWVGMSARVFNPATNLWSIYWFTNEGGGIDAASGRLDPPVVGRFDGDEGVFEGDDQFEGRPIRVRYRWTRRGADAARWQQAFSTDGGLTWETNWVGDFERIAPAPPAALPCLDLDAQVLELRRYTLHPGQRETLIGLFEREFIEAQEALGIGVLGQFRDLDAPEHFVWLRGFRDMARRATSLAAFYDGPVWQAHRNAANATMIDSDDVLLLRPAWAGSAIRMGGRTRSVGAQRHALPGLLAATVFPLLDNAPPELLRWCRETLSPAMARHGAGLLGWYLTETAANNFPRLPVREDERVLVSFAMFDDLAAFDAFAASDPFGHHHAWARELDPGLASWLSRPPLVHRLVPSARSAIHL